MLWSVPPNSSTNLEPIELQNLKFQLAHVTCNCLSCNSTKELCSTNLIIFYQQDKKVQAEDRNESFDRFTQVPNSMIEENNVCVPHQNVLCPSCIIAMNMLQERQTLVLKDEESETNSQFFCDKSTGKMIKSLEKTTSIRNNPLQKYSALSLCDFFSDWSSDIESRRDKKLKKHETVRFQDYHEDIASQQQSYKIGTKCVCLESFINTIRPPLLDINKNE